MKIILDICSIPSDLKEGLSTKEIVDNYKKDYGVDIIPIDLSKKNLEGGETMIPLVIHERNE